MLSRTVEKSISCTYQENISGHPTAFDLVYSLNTNASFVNYVAGVCPWLNKNNKKVVPSGFLNIRNVK